MARTEFLLITLAAPIVALAGCSEPESGPVAVSAIGDPPQLHNPNLRPLDPPSAFLLEAAAEGLVRFDAAGEIEPALAQSWIVSDDGRRYTFRIRSATWADGSRVTAQQVASRVRAALSRASRNPFKPVLGAIENVVAMTDQVLEISLRGPRPYFLQLLAQPEMAILLDGQGTGPYRATAEDGVTRLAVVPEDPEEPSLLPDILLRGEAAPAAVGRFTAGASDMVTGGTVGDLAIARAADQPNNRLIFDPVTGLFGLVFASAEGALGEANVREALSMAIDRQALVSSLRIPALEPRLTIVPPGRDDIRQPASPAWAASAMPARRALAARTIASLDEPVRLRVALPPGPGYRILFAHLRRDWRLIGVEAEAVTPRAPADLRLIDRVAPSLLAPWFLRQFTCDASPVCDPAADLALATARAAPDLALRQAQLATADRILADLTPFIMLASPVRWSLVAPRLTGFRPNAFARHPAGTLIAEEF